MSWLVLEFGTGKVIGVIHADGFNEASAVGAAVYGSQVVGGLRPTTEFTPIRN